MPYITSFERLGREEGRRTLLRQIIRARSGSVAETVERYLADADSAMLDRLADALGTTAFLDDILHDRLPKRDAAAVAARDMNARFWQEVAQIEEEHQTPYMTEAYWGAVEDGRRAALLRMVRAHFGVIPEVLEQRISTANAETVTQLANHIIAAPTQDVLLRLMTTEEV